MSQSLIALLAASMVGLSKSGIAGMAILTVPLMAETFGARASVGLMLPVLIAGDIMALIFYRKFARWSYILLLFPFTLLGVGIGTYFLSGISDLLLKRIMGALVIGMVLLKVLMNKKDFSSVRHRRILAPIIGVLAGISTIMANAAGPLMAVYLLWMNIKKEEFIGTGAWFFFINNVSKVPFLVYLGLITPATLVFDLRMVPAVIAGSLAGVWLVRRINQKQFRVIVLVLAAAAGLKLLLS